MMRFDRFTQRAQDVAAHAYEILQRYGHNQIDTEHMLLACLEQPDGIVPQILEKLNVDQAKLRLQLEEALQAATEYSIYGGGYGQVFITPRVKNVIDLSVEEATRFKDEFISVEHMFLAILSETQTDVAHTMQEAGVTKDRVIQIIGDLRKA